MKKKCTGSIVANNWRVPVGGLFERVRGCVLCVPNREMTAEFDLRLERRVSSSLNFTISHFIMILCIN